MLYNPKWSEPKPVEGIDLYDLISWLRTKPANETYEYVNPANCLVAQYLKSIGDENYVRTLANDTWLYRVSSGHAFEWVDFPNGLGFFSNGKMTFGAALARAESYTVDNQLSLPI